MNGAAKRTQIEYGDFQTPLELAQRVCEKLRELGVSPEVIIEPTCGTGAFLEAAASIFPSAKKIFGVEINQNYLNEAENRKKRFFAKERVSLLQGDFYNFDWESLLQVEGSLLIVGNFPWVTNSKQGAIGGKNLPAKTNFQNRSGFEAMTGKSNFDVSEWMLIQSANWLRRRGYLAMLVKTSAARKFLNYLYARKAPLSRASIYPIDARKYFGVSVEACLLFCEFDGESRHYDYEIYESLDGKKSYRVGHRNGIAVRDLDTFERLGKYYGSGAIKWRSGIKHDCSDVMELQKTEDGKLMNGLGEIVEIESVYLYPLLKGSDVANNRTTETGRYVLTTQRAVGEPTSLIKKFAPKTWEYLESHAKYLDERKSKVYRGNPRFSIFGVGEYTFAPYKIAICGLYKRLDFRLIRPIEGKPVVFDDTVYFLSFKTEREAAKMFRIISSPLVKDFYSALIFWDEKRPIKSSVLNSLNVRQFERAPTARLF